MSFGPQQPYASPTPESYDAPKKRPTGCIVGIVLAVVAVVLGGGLLCCGGLTGGGYFSVSFFVKIASQEIGRQPVVQQHLGEVTSCTIDFVATGELKKEEHFVFDVKGTKGSGVVTVHLDNSNGVRIRSGNLRLPSGETFELTPSP